MDREKRCVDLIGDGIWLGKIFNGLVPGFTEISCFLFDNGSLRAESTLNLRRLASRLQATLGCPVVPTSLLHSARVEAHLLDGRPAELLENALTKFGQSGGRRAVTLPLFFGASAALTDYVPERLREIRTQFPALEISPGDSLVGEGDDSVQLVAQALAAQVRAVREAIPPGDLATTEVIATDHGSPRSAVAHVRNLIGAALRALLAEEVRAVRVASMERRPGPAYAFNDPLLEQALVAAHAAGAKQIIVAQQFLQAGRHAGPEGDITAICAQAEKKFPGLKTYQTAVLGNRPEIEMLLARRFEAALSKSTWTR
jgi:sirohydrochlorin ferrochelatase